ncbi:MAG: hypothetical protein J0I84_21265, partial [Terrimonas sp.]|nr:hypothetical protein [Terrimonas sp.]
AKILIAEKFILIRAILLIFGCCTAINKAGAAKNKSTTIINKQNAIVYNALSKKTMAVCIFAWQ